MLPVILLTILGLLLSAAIRRLCTVLRLKQWGNKIPGPKEAWLSGNSAQMVDAGGLAFFLSYLHDR